MCACNEWNLLFLVGVENLEVGSSRCLLIIFIISSFIVFSSSGVLLFGNDIVSGGKEEVADDEEDDDDSLRNVGDGNLCRDVAYLEGRRDCVGERKTGDVDIGGVLADCDDDDDGDGDRDEDDEF